MKPQDWERADRMQDGPAGRIRELENALAALVGAARLAADGDCEQVARDFFGPSCLQGPHDDPEVRPDPFPCPACRFRIAIEHGQKALEGAIQ